jgi:hypothetical protein
MLRLFQGRSMAAVEGQAYRFEVSDSSALFRLLNLSSTGL